MEIITRIHPLARNVLAVARTGIEGSWAAYIDAVPGKSHEAEAAEVLDRGNKLPREIAEMLFSEFKNIQYRK